MIAQTLSNRIGSFLVHRCALPGLLSMCVCGTAGISPGYYDSVNTSTASLLRASLNAVISTGEIQLGYDNTWVPLRDIDEAAASANHVRLIYGGDLRPKQSGTDGDGSPVTGGWNREHMFPQSFFNQNEPMRSDIHALYPSDSDVNSRRSNSPYQNIATPTYQDVFGNKATTSLFEPADVDKGRAARAILYMDVRYEGKNGEPNLTVGNIYPGGTGAGQMAFLDTLLTWHHQYPPDALERARNYKAYRYQQNANPFVDHPEWVDDIYGGPVWVPQDGNTLTVNATPNPGGPITAGTLDVPVLVLSSKTVGQEVHLSSMKLYQSGTAAYDDLRQVRLWYDVDADGAISAPDSLLATGRFESGEANLVLRRPFFLAKGENQLLVTVTVPLWAEPGVNFSVSMPSDAFSLSTSGGLDNVTSFEPVISNIHTVAASNEPLLGLAITEVFEGSQGNLKYLEIFNGTSQTLNFATAGVMLRRYTNGNLDATNVTLPPADLAPGQVFVIANNDAEFQAAFGFAADAELSSISHNGNDSYELIIGQSGEVLDSFASDQATSEFDFAADRVAHRVTNSLPNSGDWGRGAPPPDGNLSPSGFWFTRIVSFGNSNAAQIGTPGSIEYSNTEVPDWKGYSR